MAVELDHRILYGVRGPQIDSPAESRDRAVARRTRALQHETTARDADQQARTMVLDILGAATDEDSYRGAAERLTQMGIPRDRLPPAYGDGTAVRRVMDGLRTQAQRDQLAQQEQGQQLRRRELAIDTLRLQEGRPAMDLSPSQTEGGVLPAVGQAGLAHPPTVAGGPPSAAIFGPPQTPRLAPQEIPGVPALGVPGVAIRPRTAEDLTAAKRAEQQALERPPSSADASRTLSAQLALEDDLIANVETQDDWTWARSQLPADRQRHYPEQLAPDRVRAAQSRRGMRSRATGGGSDYGRFLARWADSRGLSVEDLTAAQETQARAEWTASGRQPPPEDPQYRVHRRLYDDYVAQHNRKHQEAVRAAQRNFSLDPPPTYEEPIDFNTWRQQTYKLDADGQPVTPLSPAERRGIGDAQRQRVLPPALRTSPGAPPSPAAPPPPPPTASRAAEKTLTHAEIVAFVREQQAKGIQTSIAAEVQRARAAGYVIR